MAGTVSGQLCFWSNEEQTSYAKEPDYCFQAHADDIHSVALAFQTVISGCRDGHIKFWKMGPNILDCYKHDVIADISLGDRVWCMQTEENSQRFESYLFILFIVSFRFLLFCNRLLSVGSAACKNDCAPLTIFDIEKYFFVNLFF